MTNSALSPAPTSRRDNLHCSDIAAILGKSQRKTRLDVYRAKVGLELDVSGPDIDRGRAFEDIAATRWMMKTGMTAVIDDRPLGHPRLSFLVGHIDRRVSQDGNQLELKCPRVAKFWRTRSDGLDFDQILQGQGYTMMEDRPLCHWGIFCADNMEVLAFTIDAERAMWPVIESECDRFWNENVLPGVPPAAVNEFDHEKLAIDRIGGELQIRDDPDFIETARLLREAALILSDGEALLEEQKLRILTMIGNREPYYDKRGNLRFKEYKHGKFADAAGHLKFNYYESNGKTTFDNDSFLTTRPLVLDRVVSWILNNLDRRLDTPTVEKLFEDSKVGLDEFRSRGSSYPVFRPTYPKLEGR